MKYMIMMYGSQQDFDVLTGRGDGPTWSADDIGALHEFMGKWNNALVESGEFVHAAGLDAPVHTRRVQLQDGVAVVTDGPYAETQEVLAGYTIVETATYDRATEIAAQLANTPHPEGFDLGRDWYVDIRPVVGSAEELEL